MNVLPAVAVVLVAAYAFCMGAALFSAKADAPNTEQEIASLRARLARAENNVSSFDLAARAYKLRAERMEHELAKHDGHTEGLVADKRLLENKLYKSEGALREIEPIQQGTLAMLRREGFVFTTPLHESQGWEKLAFTLYTTICEVDEIVSRALKGDER